MSNCCSHGTLLHFSLQSSRLNICYYHQDLHPRRLHAGSHRTLLCSPWRPSYSSKRDALERAQLCSDGPVWVRRSSAIHFQGWSIRQVSCYTLLSGCRLHGHRPAVYTDQHLSWYLMSVIVRHLNRTFGSSHSASSAYQKWPTWHSAFAAGPRSSGSDILPI